PVNLHSAIKDGAIKDVLRHACLDPFLSFEMTGSKSDQKEYRRVPRDCSDVHQADTSRITSSSTGTPSGRLATPYTRRQGLLSFPKTSCSNSEAASAIFGCSRTSPEVATDTPRRTTRLTLSSDPKCCRATARTLRDRKSN